MSDGDVSDGDVSDGDVSDGDVSDGDVSDGDVSDGDVSDGDVSDGDVSGGDASDGQTAGTQAHSFTESGKENTFFTINGNLSTSKGTVVYNGMTLSKCLKMESSTSISFTAEKAGTLTLVFNSANSSNIKVDGTKYTYTTDVFTIELEAGEHTITKADTANLFYMAYTPAADTPGGDVSDGDVSGGDVSDGDVSGGDVSDGDVSGGDVSDGDVSGGDVSDGDVSGGDSAGGSGSGGSGSGSGSSSGAGADSGSDSSDEGEQDSSATENSPKTGDKAMPLTWSFLILFCGICVFCLKRAERQ